MVALRRREGAARATRTPRRRRAPRPPTAPARGGASTSASSGACSRIARAWTRVSSSSSFRAARARLRACGRRGDLLRLGDRLQGARTGGAGPRRRGPCGRSRTPGRAGGRSPSRGPSASRSRPRARRPARGTRRGRSPPASSFRKRWTPRRAASERVRAIATTASRTALSTPRRFRIARPAARISGVGSAAVQATSSISGFGRAWNFSTRSFFVRVARPLVGLQLRDDRRVRRGSPSSSSRGPRPALRSRNASPAEKGKGAEVRPFPKSMSKAEAYFSSFHHLTLGSGRGPTVAAMSGGS